MTPQTIRKYLNIELVEAPDIAHLMKYDFPNTYLANENGNIIGLNLRSNGLTAEKLDWLWKCTDLEALNLSENKLKILKLPTHLQQLRYLNIAENKGLTSLTFDGGLERLEVLNANKCKLQVLTFPAGFTRLKQVELQRNELETVNFQSACPHLEYLDVSNNKLNAFELSDGFDQLLYLHLNQNAIASLKLGALPQLNTLNLRDNQLTELKETFLDEMLELEALYLHGNPLGALYGYLEDHTLQSSLEDVQRTFRELKRGSEIDNECKILLIGNGNVGKSCMVHRITQKAFLEEWHSTHAISLVPYEFDPYQLNFWDFAGQDIYHATHRIFMQSDAVYLVLWDVAREYKPYTERQEAGQLRRYENFSLKYWLDYASVLGKNSPSIVVQTKIGANGKQDRPMIRHKFEQDLSFLAFCHVESKEEDWIESGYDHLMSCLKRAIKKTKQKKVIPESYAALRKLIRELLASGQKELEMADYLAMADGLVEAPESVLENWLVKTGVVFYQKGLFRDLIILDQERVINAVYTIFDREGFYYKKGIENDGKFSGADLAQVWSSLPEQYELAEWELFLSFMLSCELCFETTQEQEEGEEIAFEERTFVAPQLLNPDQPKHLDLIWEDRSPLYLKYKYDFMHYGVIQSFIVRTKFKAEVKDMWKYGVLLKDQPGIATIEANNQEINIKITRDSQSLFDKIQNLLEKLEDLPGEKWVSVDGVGFVNIEDLQDFKKNEMPRIRDDQNKWWAIEEFDPFLIPRDKQDSFTKGIREEVMNCIREDDLLDAIKILSKVAAKDISNDLINLQSNLRRITKAEEIGKLDFGEAGKEYAKIRDAIMGNLDRMEEM